MTKKFTRTEIGSTLFQTFIILVTLGLFSTINAQSPVIFSSSGTFTVPPCVTSFTVQCWGGGGGGGGASEASGGTAGAGGGGGGYATAVITNASGSYTVTVGTGGTGGIGTSNTGGTSTAGGNSSVSNGTVTVTAIGGGAGAGQSAAGVATGVGAGGGGSFIGVTGSPTPVATELWEIIRMITPVVQVVVVQVMQAMAVPRRKPETMPMQRVVPVDREVLIIRLTPAEWAAVLQPIITKTEETVQPLVAVVLAVVAKLQVAFLVTVHRRAMAVTAVTDRL